MGTLKMGTSDVMTENSGTVTWGTTAPTGTIIGVENTTTTSIVAKSDSTFTTIISDSITVQAGSKVLINEEYPFALIKYLDKNFNKDRIFQSKNGTFKIFIPKWLKI